MTTAEPSTARPIAIVGGGPIGLACALLLARRGMATVVIEPRTLAQARGDRRLLALGRGSLQTLTPLLGGQSPAWAPIRRVHVSSAGEFGSVLLAEPDEAGPLGATVRYGDLLAALDAAVAAAGLVELRRGVRALGIEQQPDRVLVRLDGGDGEDSLEAALAVHAEGIGSAGDEAAAPAGWALVADVELEGVAPGTAFERFTREGPLALLPAPASPAAWSLAWCGEAAAVQRRAALGEAAFCGELQHAIGPRLARVVRAGPRGALALARRSRARVHEHRVVWLGNAAQTLHPVAGQGFNLGLRDCATLADAAAAARTHAGADGLPAAIEAYARRRRADRATIGAFTDWLPDLFATRAAPVAVARMLGLAALDQMPAARRELAQLLMFGVRA